MITKLEHIGIAVKNLEESEKLFEKLLGISPYKREKVDSEGVITSFFKVGDIKIELLAPTGPESTVAKFIEKRGEGLHHLAFDTNDLSTTLSQKIEEGFQVIHNTPKKGADQKLIAFLHPKSTNGVLTELCSDQKPVKGS